jgi:hypothetical protein
MEAFKSAAAACVSQMRSSFAFRRNADRKEQVAITTRFLESSVLTRRRREQ